MSRKATLKQVATAAGVSLTTVSRALAGHDDVAETTRVRIRRAADRLGYVPGHAGKALVTGRSGFVALLLPLRDESPFDPFLGEFVGGLSEGLLADGRDLFLATVPAGRSELDVLRHVVESGRADGLVLTRIAENDARVDFLVERGFPFIAHGRTLDTPARYSWVDTDGAAAFAEGFELLHGLGHRAFGLVSITAPMTFRLTREGGLESALAEVAARRAAAGAPADGPDATLRAVHVDRFDAARHAAAIAGLLASPERPTAVLALTDELALTVLAVARDLGLSVPEDLSVLGFDDLPAARWTRPGLTTFDQRTRETALELAHTLGELIDGRTAEQHRLLRPHLVARGSHGPAPIHVRRPARLAPSPSDHAQEEHR